MSIANTKSGSHVKNRRNAGTSQTVWLTPPTPPDLRASNADSSGLVGLARPGIARSRSLSSLQLVDLVHVHRRAIAIRGEHDRQADRDLRRGDDEDEDDEDAPALVQRIAGREHPGAAGERDEREGARVQHELDAHKDHDPAAPDEHAPGAAEEDPPA